MGLVLYPDNYSGDAISGNVSNLPEGVVFLPFAGSRLCSKVSYAGDTSFYWSSSSDDEYSASSVYIASTIVFPDSSDLRFAGYSVRLVTESK